jgi:hypothetical protein
MTDLATGLQAIVDSSATMVTWALAVGAASVAAIVSTSYLRPQQLRTRVIYLLFPVGWVLLGLSILHGNSIARSGIAAQLTNSRDRQLEIGAAMNTEYIAQQFWLMLGLTAFALWLLFYLVWWIAVEKLPESK